MTQLGWVLYLNHPKDIEKLPEEERVAACKSHFQKCFQEIEGLLVNGLRFAVKRENIGNALIVGPEDECQKLKKLLQQKGLGDMIHNATTFIWSNPTT